MAVTHIQNRGRLADVSSGPIFLTEKKKKAKAQFFLITKLICMLTAKHPENTEKYKEENVLMERKTKGREEKLNNQPFSKI